jgi:hypothetical protein
MRRAWRKPDSAPLLPQIQQEATGVRDALDGFAQLRLTRLHGRGDFDWDLTGRGMRGDVDGFVQEFHPASATFRIHAHNLVADVEVVGEEPVTVEVRFNPLEELIRPIVVVDISERAARELGGDEEAEALLAQLLDPGVDRVEVAEKLVRFGRR